MKFRGFYCGGIRLELFDGGAAAGGEGAGGAAPGATGADNSGESKVAGPADAGRGEERRRSAARGLTTERSGRIDGPEGRQTARAVGGVRYPSGQPGAELDRPKKSGEKAVLYGKQAAQETAPADAGQGEQTGLPDPGKEAEREAAPKEAATPDTREAKRKAFLALISGEGEYKAQFDEQVQRIINKRFGQVKGLEAQLGAQKPILDMLAERYGVTDADPQKLFAALEKDDALFARGAEEAGMTVEQFKRFKRMERENAAFRETERRAKETAYVQSKVQDWFRQGEEMKGDYPDFDLTRETENPKFLSMLRAGVPVRHAYEVMHMDEIKAGVAQMQAKATEKQVVDGIRAKGARPAENGTASQSGFTIKDDPARLTRQDRAEIVRRVARGEKISF